MNWWSRCRTTSTTAWPRAAFSFSRKKWSTKIRAWKACSPNYIMSTSAEITTVRWKSRAKPGRPKLDAKVIALIKPQFEAGKGRVGKKGVIRNPSLHLEVLTDVIAEADSMGFGLGGAMRSPVTGQKGNREFLVLWERGPSSLTPLQRDTQIKEAVWDETN